MQTGITEHVVYCEWVDSRGTSDGWEFIEGLEPLAPAQCKTVGFLIEETESYITLAMSLGEGQVWARKTIPACCIIAKKKLS
jgi:hypothetical protein